MKKQLASAQLRDSSSQNHECENDEKVFKEPTDLMPSCNEQASSSSSAKGRKNLKRTKSDKKSTAMQQKKLRKSTSEQPSEEKLRVEEIVGIELPTCGICWERMQFFGRLDCCEHKFCFDCISKWTKLNESCPHCRNKVNRIIKIDAKSGKRKLTKDFTKKGRAVAKPLNLSSAGLAINNADEMVLEQQFPSFLHRITRNIPYIVHPVSDIVGVGDILPHSQTEEHQQLPISQHQLEWSTAVYEEVKEFLNGIDFC